MDFRHFFFSLAPDDRERFAGKAGTSVGYLTQVAYRNKALELGFADVICTLSTGQVGLDDLHLTANAQRQRAIREGIDAHVEQSP